MIKKFGPIGLFTSFKFERGHKDLKDDAATIMTLKNIQFSLSSRAGIRLSMMDLPQNFPPEYDETMSLSLEPYDRTLPKTPWPHKKLRKDDDHEIIRRVVPSIKGHYCLKVLEYILPPRSSTPKMESICASESFIRWLGTNLRI